MAALFIAIIGAGLIGRRHATEVNNEQLTTLAAIVEPSPDGPKIASSYGVPCFSSLDALLASRESDSLRVDAAIVATPTHTHVSLGIQLVNAGVHALIEKPISADIEEARLLVDAVQNSNGKTKILIGHHRRFNPYTVALKASIESGKLGKLLGIQGTWAVKKDGDYFKMDWRTLPVGGGVININLIHDIDLLRYFLGDITRVYCEEGERTRGHPVEETGAIVLRFKSGVVGTFFFSDAAASPWCWEGATGENPDLVGLYSKPVYTLFGTAGSIQLPTLELQTFSHLQNPAQDGHWLTRLSTDETFSTQAQSLLSTAPFTLQLRHFVRVCRDEEDASCTALEAFQSLQVLEAVKISIREKRVVDVPV